MVLINIILRKGYEFMTGFKGIVNQLGCTYLDRFYEKLAYVLSENIDIDVSCIKTLSLLADEMCFTDDGYLYEIIDSNGIIDDDGDIKFKIEHIKKNDSYALLIDNKLYMVFDSLTSTLKASIEEYFYV